MISCCYFQVKLFLSHFLSKMAFLVGDTTLFDLIYRVNLNSRWFCYDFSISEPFCISLVCILHFTIEIVFYFLIQFDNNWRFGQIEFLIVLLKTNQFTGQLSVKTDPIQQQMPLEGNWAIAGYKIDTLNSEPNSGFIFGDFVTTKTIIVTVILPNCILNRHLAFWTNLIMLVINQNLIPSFPINIRFWFAFDLTKNHVQTFLKIPGGVAVDENGHGTPVTANQIRASGFLIFTSIEGYFLKRNQKRDYPSPKSIIILLYSHY